MVDWRTNWTAGRVVSSVSRGAGDSAWTVTARLVGEDRHTVRVDDGRNAYLVHDVPGHALEKVSEQAPRPNDATDKTFARYVETGDPGEIGGDRVVVHRAGEDGEVPECDWDVVGTYHELSSYDGATPIPGEDLHPLPDFRFVAVDETAHWRPEIIRETGRAFGVYLMDANQTVNLCEITPSIHLTFLHNSFENLPDEEGEYPTVGSEGDLRREDDGHGMYLHANHARMLTPVHPATPRAERLLAYERYVVCRAEDREEMHDGFVEELVEWESGNGVDPAFDAPTPPKSAAMRA